jgi:hypothetical protein
MKKNFNLLLLISLSLLLLFSSCEKDLYDDIINQDKQINIKQISLEKFNSKMRQMKNKPDIERFMVSSKNSSVLNRTESTSDFEIKTDDIKEITQGDYTSYTMYVKTLDTTNSIYNITIEEVNSYTTFFITKYIPSTYWLENKNLPYDGEIITFREPNINSDGAVSLQEYMDLIGDDLYAAGSGGGNPTSGFGNNLGPSTIYPSDCNGEVHTTIVVEALMCSDNVHWPWSPGTCYANRKARISTRTYYECIPNIGGNPNDSGNTSGSGNTTGGNTLGGGSSGAGNGTGNGTGGISTGTITGSITTIVDPIEECIPPEGDLNRDCILDYNEAQFLIFYNDLTAEQQAIVDAGENTTDFFNYFSQNGFNDESREFIEELIDLELNGNLLSFFPTFKYPIGSNYSTLYPKLTEYLKNKIPQLINNQFIINKLVEYSELTSQQIKSDLKWGKGPTIQIAQLDYLGEDCYGVFRSSIPNVLTIDVDFVELLENSTPGPQGDSMAFLLGVTILHEYVHLGDFVDDIDQPGEEGLLFEQATYGETIWLNNAGDVLIKWQ